jgi:hypothetical protein
VRQTGTATITRMTKLQGAGTSSFQLKDQPFHGLEAVS